MGSEPAADPRGDGEGRATRRPAPVRVRLLLREDVPAVLDLVTRQEFARGLAPAALRRVFDYPWTPERPHGGFVLVADERIVGCTGVIFSRRVIEGREHGFANTTTAFVEPEYRGYSLLLMKAVMELQDWTLVTLTASPEVARVLERIGFEVVSRRRLAWSPFALPFSGGGVTILDQPSEIEPLLDDAQRRVLRDHLPWCGHYLVNEGARRCYVVTRRRHEKGWFLPRIFPRRLRARYWAVSDLLHVSDPAVAVRHWAALRRRIGWRERSLAITAEESFLGGLAPDARSTPHHVHAYRRRTDPRTIDGLYSELVLLERG